MKKLTAALIGCGRIGTKKHIEAFAANSDLIDLVAVCDLVPEKAEKATEEYMKRGEIALARGEKERKMRLKVARTDSLLLHPSLISSVHA